MLPERLLHWYETSARDLPWRTGPAARRTGERPDPYRIWLSEVMLQQTTIPHATRYFLDFTQRWPSVEALAVACDEDVMSAWAGLGYYARARNLLKCAREVAALGGFPQTRAGLEALPGIGPYTSGAIAAIAFGQVAAAVDGNVERVFSRLMATKGDWTEEKQRIREMVEALVPAERPGEFAEALMDLGATLCTPKSPNCLICPLSELCEARREGDPARYPIKPKKSAKPTWRGHVVLVRDGDLLRVERRPERGLLGGMLGLPTSDWGEAAGDAGAVCKAAGGSEATLERLGEVRHVFTHFALELDVWTAQRAPGAASGDWAGHERLKGLPSVFAKAVRLLD